MKLKRTEAELLRFMFEIERRGKLSSTALVGADIKTAEELAQFGMVKLSACHCYATLTELGRQEARL